MPEKRNDSKIMAMLERRGVVRKVGADDGSYSDEASDAPTNSGSDIKTLIETPNEAVKVTQAPRQPVPGMPSPIFPSEKPAGTRSDVAEHREQTRPERVFTEEKQAPVSAVSAPEPLRSASQPASARPQVPAVSAAPPVAAAPPAAQPKPSSAFSGLNIFRNGGSSESKPAMITETVERDQQPENYTDRFLGTEELYEALALRSRKTDSIYLIEEYLETLPDSLPDSARREIVGKLIAASGFDYDLLIGDGVLRVKMLKEYAERFARHTDDYIAARQAEIDEMEQQILRSRRLIDNRKELHKRQFYSIEAEAQRLKDILTFISG